MSIFDGIERAEVFESSPKMNPNHSYRLEVVRMTERKSGQGNGMIVPVEFKILETTDPAYRPGDNVSWVPKQSHGHAFLSNLKAFALAIAGLPATKENLENMDQRDPEDPKGRSYVKGALEDAVSEGNTFAGATVRCQTAASTPKGKPDQKFVVHRFSPD